MSTGIITCDKPTLYDRDAKALEVIYEYVRLVGSETTEQAFLQNRVRVANLVHLAEEVARFGATLNSVDDLWSVKRALQHDNHRFFSVEYASEAGELLEQALLTFAVKDQGTTYHRYYPESDTFFVSIAEFEAYVVKDLPMRMAVAQAKNEFFERFGNERGPFDVDRAGKTYRTHGHARYFDDEISGH